MKKVVFILMLMVFGINATAVANQGEVINNCKEEYFQEQIESVTALDVKTIAIEYLENGDCTVTVSVTYKDVTASFSVTAPDCEQAGAGAVQASIGFIKELKKLR